MQLYQSFILALVGATTGAVVLGMPEIMERLDTLITLLEAAAP